MASRERVVEDIIEECFGTYLLKLMRPLIEARRLSFASIVHNFCLRSKAYRDKEIGMADVRRMPKNRVEVERVERDIKEALRMLICHNMVYFEEVDGTTYYIFVAEMVVRRIRYASYVVECRNQFGYSGEMIGEVLLQHGRLTAIECKEKVKEATQTGGGNPLTDSDIEEGLERMIGAGYVERVPHPYPNRVHQAMKGGEPSITADHSWRLHVLRIEQFLLVEQMQLMVKNLFGERTGQVFAVMMQLRKDSIRASPLPMLQISGSISLEEILEEWMKLGIEMISREQLQESLFALFQANPAIVVVGEENYGRKTLLTIPLREAKEITVKHRFYIDYGVLVYLMRLQVLESALETKFGSDALAISRLLLDKKYLEQRQIAEILLLPLKAVRSTLYRMLADGYIHLQEIPRTGDRTPARTFYLWTMSISEAVQQLRVDLYSCIRLMRCRERAGERGGQRGGILLARVQQMDVILLQTIENVQLVSS